MRIWGCYYAASMKAGYYKKRANYVHLHTAKVIVGVLSVNVQHFERSRLHVRIEYVPGLGGDLFDDGTSQQKARRYPVGSANEIGRSQTTERFFAARGRSYPLGKRFMEVVALSTSTSFPYVKRRQFQRGAVMQNRTLYINTASHAESVEVFEYSVLQSRIKEDVLPWNEHTGRLVLFLRRSGVTIKHQTVSCLGAIAITTS